MRKSSKGFTLIELLVVIVIIGILAGVLIAVINPQRQQNRARNGTIKATIQKVAFAMNTVRAGLGRLPYETELTAELDNVTPNASCTAVDALNCTFTTSGVVLPDSCGSGLVGGDASSACEFGIYSADTAIGNFRIAAKQHKLAETDAGMVYVFDSSSGLYDCAEDFAWSTGDVSGCTAIAE